MQVYIEKERERQRAAAEKYEREREGAPFAVLPESSDGPDDG